MPETDLLPCWCGGTPWTTVFRTPRFGLLRCGSCTGYRIDPPPLTRDGAADEFYSSYYRDVDPPAPPNPGARTSRYWRVAARVPALRRVGRLAIDVGCGDGILCAELQDAGWREVVGVDASRPRVERARRRFPGIRLLHGGIADARVAAGAADLVVLDNVIEHLPQPVEALASLAECLAPNGRLVVITPNMESGQFRLLGRRWTPELAPHTHVFLFTPAALARAAAMAGLEVTAAGTFHVPGTGPTTWLRDLARGEVRVAAWRAIQAGGNLWARLTGAGPMQYVVATVRSGAQGAAA